MSDVTGGNPLEEVTAVLERTRRRTVARVLQAKELYADPVLSESERIDFRKDILDALGDYHDLALELMATVARDDVILNGHALELLEAIHGAVVPRA